VRKCVDDGADVVRAIDHAPGNVWVCAWSRTTVKAGNGRKLALRVDEINPNVVLGVIQVIGGGYDEPKAGERLQRIDIIDDVVLTAMRKDNDRKMSSGNWQVFE